MSEFMYNLAMDALKKEKRKLTNIKEYLLNRDKYREDIVNYFTDEISDVNERIERLKERKDG